MAHPPLGVARMPLAPAAAHRRASKALFSSCPSHHHHQPPRPSGARASSSLHRQGRRARAPVVSASGGPADWLVPDALVKALDPPTSSGADSPSPSASAADETATNKNLTVYTLRLTTSAARNAGATDPSAAVQVLLLGSDGRAVLRRVPPLYDPKDAERQARHICSVVAGGGGSAEGVGADCSRFLAEEEEEAQKASDDQKTTTTKSATTTTASPAPPPRPAPPGPVRPRFQPGAVDEVSFLAPDLGHPLAALIVAPESGTWMLDEATVSSSRTGRSDRFVCRSLLGSGAPGAARAAERRRGGGGSSSSFSSKGPAYLTPVAAGAVVVGEGSAARALTRAEAEALHEQGMDGYSRLRGRVTAATAVLAATGSFIAGLVGGVDAAAPFALGGLAGLGYWALLQLGVAAALPPEGAALEAAVGGAEENARSASPVSLTAAAAARPTGSPLIRFLGSGPFRVAAVGAVAVIAASAARYWGPAPGGVGASSLGGGGGGGGGGGSTAVEAPLVAGTTATARNNSPHSALRPFQLGLAAAGFLSYKVAVVGVGALGWGGGDDDEGDDGGGGRGGGNGGGGNGGTALSARELEAMLAMRAPSPSAGTEAGAEDGEEDD